MDKVDYTQMTGAERVEHFTRLSQLMCGSGAPLTEPKGQWIVPIIGEVRPKRNETLMVQPHLKFRPRRLIIFESEVEHYETVIVSEEKETIVESKSWWFGKQQVTREHHPAVRKNVVSISLVRRSGWLIHTMLVGQRLQFPSAASLSGEAFAGNDPRFDLDADWCDVGWSISLQVENLRSYDAPFRAAIVGEREVEPALKAV